MSEQQDQGGGELPDDIRLGKDFRRTRREHGGAPQRLDDDQLAELAEEERAEFGVDAFDPDEVPPAADEAPLPQDVPESAEVAEERAELRREVDKGEVWSIDEQHPFPPTRYEDS